MLTRNPARNRTISTLLRTALAASLLALVAGGAQASSIFDFGEEGPPSRSEFDDFDRESKSFTHRSPRSEEVRARITSALERFFERHRRNGDSGSDSMSDRIVLGRLIDMFRRRHSSMDHDYPYSPEDSPMPAVPEPGTALLLGLALAGLAATRRD
jgi:hypothetical protein